MRLNKYTILILSFVVLGCSLFGLNNEISITNSHTSAIMVSLWDRETSDTVELKPAVSVDKVSFVQINSKQSVTLSRNDIRGDNDADELRLYLFEVKGDSAYYQRTFTFSFSEEINIHHNNDGFHLDS